jgi:hypothetical protein
MIQHSKASLFTKARKIASRFELPEPFELGDFPMKGNINQQAYLITSRLQSRTSEYILQQINPNVFRQPRSVMQAMIACLNAQRRALSEMKTEEKEEWEIIRLVPTKEGNEFLEFDAAEGPECWRVMARIRDACAFQSLRQIADPEQRLRIAEETGRGLAFFHNLTAGMETAGLSASLPGYRDTQLYYDQLVSVLEGSRTPEEAFAYMPDEETIRQCTEQQFLIHLDPAQYTKRMADPQIRRLIDIALEQKEFALSLLQDLRCGRLHLSVIHGDTKLENFLFSTQTGRVRSLVDLDTIMPHNWLSDWGDMIRSLVNVAGEKERDLRKIEIDMEIFKASARGFLSSIQTINPDEIRRMPKAPQIMALELGVRFLADYLRGDNYFRPSPGEPEELNKIRALVQFSVFERLRANAEAAGQYIQALGKHHR